MTRAVVLVLDGADPSFRIVPVDGADDAQRVATVALHRAMANVVLAFDRTPTQAEVAGQIASGRGVVELPGCVALYRMPA